MSRNARIGYNEALKEYRRPGSWLVPIENPANPRTILVCFPQAGAGPSSFTPLAGYFGPQTGVWAVCPPGREFRLADPVLSTLDDLVPALAKAISDLPRDPDTQLVFVGHCVGALVAYELAHRGPSPAHLVVIGQTSPAAGTPPPGAVAPHELDLPDLIEYLRAKGTTAPEVLARQDYMRMLAPAIRADLRLAHAYQHDDARPRLLIPVTAIAGRDDLFTPAEQALDWYRFTSAAFSLHLFAGSSFLDGFLLEALQMLRNRFS